MTDRMIAGWIGLHIVFWNDTVYNNSRRKTISEELFIRRYHQKIQQEGLMGETNHIKLNWDEKAVEEAKKNREWRHEYMMLLMRDQEHEEKGKVIVITNAFETTKSIKQTATILQ